MFIALLQAAHAMSEDGSGFRAAQADAGVRAGEGSRTAATLVNSGGAVPTPCVFRGTLDA